MNDPDFAWISFYEHLADALVRWRDRQPELIGFLEGLRAKDLPVTPLSDRDETGRQFLLSEIDPFTFLGVFNRGVHRDARRRLLAEARTFFELADPVPDDFSGVPFLNNLGSWFISYQHKRAPDDVARLWDVFAAALGTAPLADPQFLAAFDRALQVRHTNVNLTLALFWIRPRRFLSLDRPARTYLSVSLPARGIDAAWYVGILERARQAHGDDFARLSHAAWQAPADAPKTATSWTSSIRDDIDYWFVGAYWDDAAAPDQTERFLREGIWENGYTDRYLDSVRKMRPGDRIAIKASAVQSKDLPFDARGHTVSRMTLKAVGTVVANRDDGRVVEVEWTPLTPPRQWYFYTSMQTLWRLKKEKALAQELIRFAFHGEGQSYDHFIELWWGSAAAQDQPPSVEVGEPEGIPANQPYGLADLRRDGVFMSDVEVQQALSRLRTKKNLVLQGAPGTGKTFVAEKLAWMLMSEVDRSRRTIVQFHPSTSYEDFVRGYRPTDQAGQFALRDGPFLEVCARARADDRPHVIIVDEINRGNLAQIFGELLMLLEADKRGSGHAITPLYRRSSDERLDIPENVHVIGTMNLADRSLALVDFALRRRFAFMTLEPRFGTPEYAAWLLGRKLPRPLLQLIEARMRDLNQQIADDPRLGPALCIGHSFFCPAGADLSSLGAAWFREIVQTEIAPLLDEYWHDDRRKAQLAREALLA